MCDEREQISASAVNPGVVKNVDINQAHEEGNSNTNGPNVLDSEEQHGLIF